MERNRKSILVRDDYATSNQHDSILDEAKEITGGDRMDQYGHPKYNFQDIATLWTAYLKVKIRQTKGMLSFDNIQNAVIDSAIDLTPKDVAMMMVEFKQARELAGHKRDNLVDMAGYVRNIAQIECME